jgi:hypothetical protein
VSGGDGGRAGGLSFAAGCLKSSVGPSLSLFGPPKAHEHRRAQGQGRGAGQGSALKRGACGAQGATSACAACPRQPFFAFTGRDQFARLVCRARATVNCPAGAGLLIVEPPPMVAPAPMVTGATSTQLLPM